MLSGRQKDVLAMLIAQSDLRASAVALDMGFTTLERHVKRIQSDLELSNKFVKFSEIPLGDWFIHNGERYQRVDRAIDNYGGYNAQDKDGNRILVLYHKLVIKG